MLLKITSLEMEGVIQTIQTKWKNIINHLWCCCSNCDGDSEVLTEKWLSILYHIRGIHSWEGEKHFHKSEHGPLEKE